MYGGDEGRGERVSLNNGKMSGHVSLSVKRHSRILRDPWIQGDHSLGAEKNLVRGRERLSHGSQSDPFPITASPFHEGATLDQYEIYCRTCTQYENFPSFPFPFFPFSFFPF